MLQFGASLTDDTRSVNYDRNTFITQATGYAARSINYAEKSVMVLTLGACTIKLFTVVIYAFL